MSEIIDTRAWFSETGQIPYGAEPNVRQTAFYLGMQLEEMAEKLEALGLLSVSTDLQGLATSCKNGEMDVEVGGMFKEPARVKEFLDADADILWVTIGAAAAAGSDLYGAFNQGVSFANWAKKFPDGTFHRHPNTGKVLKPDGWEPADLTPYVHPTLRGEA